jgi:hypothetical protein
MPRHPQNKRIKPPARLDKDGMYICLECKRRGDTIRMRWYPKEIPRHLEKAHNFPEKACVLRMHLIPDWNENFEKEYLENLYNQIKWEKHDLPDDIEIDITSTKFKKEEKERKKREQEAARESD